MSTPKSAAELAYTLYSASRVNEPLDENEKRHFLAGFHARDAEVAELVSALKEIVEHYEARKINGGHMMITAFEALQRHRAKNEGE